MNNAEKVNVNIIEEWIAGRGKNPVTWKTLTETLRDTGLNVLAGEIEAVKSYNKAQLCELYSIYVAKEKKSGSDNNKKNPTEMCLLHLYEL